MDGYDYDVIYQGKVIGNVKAFTDEDALHLAQHMYGSDVTVERS